MMESGFGLVVLSLSLYAIDMALLLRLKQLSETIRSPQDPEWSIIVDWVKQIGPEQLFFITFIYVGLLVFAKFFTVVYFLLVPLQCLSLGVSLFLNNKFGNGE